MYDQGICLILCGGGQLTQGVPVHGRFLCRQQSDNKYGGQKYRSQIKQVSGGRRQKDRNTFPQGGRLIFHPLVLKAGGGFRKKK